MLQNEYVHTLMDLGLTLVQAKVYVTLCKLESATIKTISRTANLARQDIYRIMPTLQEMGLVEKIIAEPTRYRAIPIKSGVATLLQCKTREHEELKKKTTELLESLANLQEINVKTAPQEEEPQFIVTSAMSLLFRRFIAATQASQKSIDSVGTLESFEPIASQSFEDFQKAMERGVRIRLITEKPQKNKPLPPCVKVLQKNPLYELRFISAPAPVTMSILDKREMSICIATPTYKAVPNLWSNNPAILALATNYFEEIWNKASIDKQNTRWKVIHKIISPKEKESIAADHKSPLLRH
jgi:sugar-specific transcriptional regulator TrmB